MATLDDLPPLPVIENAELRIKVYTHKGFEGRPAHLDKDEEESSSNDRLYFLGKSVLQMCVTDWLFDKYPLHRNGWLTKRRDKLIQKERLSRWSKAYGLPQKMRTHWSSKCVVETSPTEQAAVLEAYIAAVFLEGGLPAVNEFVIPLMQTVGEHELV